MNKKPNNFLTQIGIAFPEPFEKPPKVTLQKPSNGGIRDITRTGFTLHVQATPIKTRRIEVEYKVNFESRKITIELQWCPSCAVILGPRLQFMPMVAVSPGQMAPGLPLDICPNCGAVFVAYKTMEMFRKQKETRIIKPSGVIVGRKE